MRNILKMSSIFTCVKCEKSYILPDKQVEEKKEELGVDNYCPWCESIDKPHNGFLKKKTDATIEKYKKICPLCGTEVPKALERELKRKLVNFRNYKNIKEKRKQGVANFKKLGIKIEALL